jgi:hypothetical protein
MPRIRIAWITTSLSSSRSTERLEQVPGAVCTEVETFPVVVLGCDERVLDRVDGVSSAMPCLRAEA